MNYTSQKFLTTIKFAEQLLVKPETVRRSLCQNGHYMGIRPVKLPNGRLAWSEAALNDITSTYES